MQDGYDLYLHGFIVTATGNWCVVQQGMSDARGAARRYHWLSENLRSFLDSPHSAIDGRNQGTIVNLADVRAARSRSAGLELVQRGPDPIIATLRRYRDRGNTALDLFPSPHPIRSRKPDNRICDGGSPRGSRIGCDIAPAARHARSSRRPRSKGFCRAATHRRGWAHARLPHWLLSPKSFTAHLADSQTQHAFLSHMVVRTAIRFPCRCAYMTKRSACSERPWSTRSWATMRRSRRSGRLDTQARVLERMTTGPQFDALVSDERARSQEFGGRSVLSS